MSPQVSELPPKAQSKPVKSRVVRNVLSNWGAYVMAVGVSFFLSPYIVHHLGNTGYGVWTLIQSLTGYLGLLDLGVRGAVTRYIARFHTQADHAEASQTASSAMAMFATAGLVAVLTSCALALFVIGHLHVPPQYYGAARIVLILLGLNIATSLVNGVFGGILVGLQRFDLTNSIEVGFNILRAAAIVIVLHLGFGIVTLACVQLGFTLARWGANVALARFLYPELKIRLADANRAGVKLILSYSIFAFLLHVSGMLIYATDNIVIAAYVPAIEAVAFYAIGWSLVDYTRTLVSGISQTMTPLASSLEARGGPGQLQRLTLLSSRSATMVVAPIVITFLLRGGHFLGLWMGREYIGPSGHVLFLLSVPIIFWAGNSSISGILLGVSKHKPLVFAMAGEGLCNLALSIYLVKRIGILGVAWGTVIPNLANNLIFWPWYIRRSLGPARSTYAVSAWVRPLVSLVPFILGTYAMERFWPAANIVLFFAQVAFVLPLALAGYWLICLDRDQRETIAQKLSGTFQRIFARP